MANDQITAKWCKAGDHAFDPQDPDMHITTLEDAEGNTVRIATCGEHTPSIFRKKTSRNTSPDAILGETLHD